MKSKACVEVVVVASDGTFLIWDSRGTNYVAEDAAALSRFVLEIVANEDIPNVEFASPKPGALMKAAARIVDTLSRRAADPDEAVGVHLVVQWTLEPWSSVVWPPKGGPRPAMNPAKLGELLSQLAADPSQPRVPAGPPPDATENLFEGVGSLVEQWVRPGGSAA